MMDAELGLWLPLRKSLLANASNDAMRMIREAFTPSEVGKVPWETLNENRRNALLAEIPSTQLFHIKHIH